MPKISEHLEGMPCWIDASVSTSAEREGLIDFYGALFGWTFDVGAPVTGFYSIARHDGSAVLGIGEQSDGQGRWVTYFSTPNIETAISRAKEYGSRPRF
jgi:predicted enzyme related to lactoylglutathione lyase